MTEIPRNRVRQGELLAGMIEHQDLAEKGVQALQDRNFTTPKAKCLFRAVKAVLEAGEAVSMATVTNWHCG
jgi:replicative DNA helicase